MTFSNDKAIYVQMAERLCDEIISGTYKADDRIPSVRDYAVTLEVNTNTAVKAYDLLARENIIYNKRGLGYFVSPGASEQILSTRRETFMKETLPQFFQSMKILGLDIKDIEKVWQKDNSSATDTENK
nr:GntR family transcriptional regulator [Prevotella sp.]